MRRRPDLFACVTAACLLVAGADGFRVEAQAQPPGAQVQAQAAEQAPPKDLRPLLQPRQSEMRLVAARYSLDRTTLSGNYQGGMQQGFGRGRRAAGAVAVAEPDRAAEAVRPRLAGGA